MANGSFRLGKQSGGTLGLVFPDGVSNTEVVLPESGELATKEYVDTGAGVAFVANDARVKTALNASGTAPIYACRAWVNFNGTGTVAIRASGNVSSITDNGAGNYTVNFTTAMKDNNFATSALMGSARSYSGWSDIIVKGNQTNTNVTVSTESVYGGGYDNSNVLVSIFR